MRQVDRRPRGTIQPDGRPRGWAGRFVDHFLRPHSGLVEMAILGLLYAGYSLSRLLADDDLQAARERAYDILHWEHLVGLDVETVWDHFFATHDALGVFASYWYATGHYLVTAAVLYLLYRHGGGHYVWARTALVLSTVAGLVVYLLLPTAPPRLSGLPYVDVLAEHSDLGWWGAEASAPQGLGGLTNQLAAMPSLHAGWAVWVAAVAFICGTHPIWKVLATAYAVTTSVVVIGTGNHWVSDVLVGLAVVLVAVVVCRPLGAMPADATDPGVGVVAPLATPPARSTTVSVGSTVDKHDAATRRARVDGTGQESGCRGTATSPHCR